MTRRRTRVPRVPPGGIETWPAGEALAHMLRSQAEGVAAVESALPELVAASEAAAARLRRGNGRLIYAGAGSSGRVAAQDLVELRPTFGWPEERMVVMVAGGPGALLRTAEGAEDDASAGEAAVMAAKIGSGDVVVGVAASGMTPWTVAVVRGAGRQGALTIGVANRWPSLLLEIAQHPIHLPTPAEALPGSTRLAAGTAQKIALNLFSTRLMMNLGRVHRGRMVHMIASNAKLVARGEAMVAELASVSAERAAALFSAARQRVPIALLLARGLSEAEAQRRLDEAGGDVGVALSGLPSPQHDALTD